MSAPFIGEIRMGGWNFAPQGWAQCNGALMSISQNDALFALIGTIYGGDGQNTFGLPDLRGRIPVHMGGSFPNIGQPGGNESVSLTIAQIPNHSHRIMSTASAASSGNPAGMAPALAANNTAIYNAPNIPTPMANVYGTYGANLPHENMMPYLAVTFVIALSGVFPSRN